MAKNRVQVQGVSAPKLGNSIGGMGQTFVTPDQSNRGSQIAKALQNVGGITQTIASNKIQEQKEEVRLVDGIKAKNAYGVLAPSLVEHMNNQDYSITEREDGIRRRATADEMFASWANTEEYQGQLSQFGSESAKRAFEGSMAQAVAETYGKASVDFDQREMRETFSQELQVSIANGTPNAWDSYDARLVDTGLMSRPEAMAQIQSDAEHMYRTTGDDSGFDYMEAKGMGNNEFKAANEDKKDAITNDREIKSNRSYQRDQQVKAKAKSDLMVQVSTRLAEDPHADLDDLEQQAIEAGIGDFRGTTNTLRLSYNPSMNKDYKMNVSNRVELQKQLTELPTRAQQLQFMEENSSVIDSSTAGTWLGWINSGSLPTFRNNDIYKGAMKTLDQRIEFAQGSNENVFKIKEHVDDTMIKVVQGERWKKAEEDGDIGEMMVIMQDVVTASTQLANAGAELSYTASGREAEEDAERQAEADKVTEANRKRLEDLEKQFNK